MPDCITIIDMNCFEKSIIKSIKFSERLTSIDIPSSVVEISKFTFHGPGIKELNISRGVKLSKEGYEDIKVNYID